MPWRTIRSILGAALIAVVLSGAGCGNLDGGDGDDPVPAVYTFDLPEVFVGGFATISEADMIGLQAVDTVFEATAGPQSATVRIRTDLIISEGDPPDVDRYCLVDPIQATTPDGETYEIVAAGTCIRNNFHNLENLNLD